MLFARRVFAIAGIYGFLVLTPMLFLEQRVGTDTPPPITHPEFFYGFLGVALVFQLLFLIVSRDPVRYRPMMVPSFLEKFGFFAAVLPLYLAHRTPVSVLAMSSIDCVLGILFVMSFLRTRPVATDVRPSA